jgi:hypothetical protein
VAKPKAKSKSRSKRQHRVFVSHSGDDTWVATQIAKLIEERGASTFLDRRDIAAGDDFKRRIRDELPTCTELLALFTPWSRTRTWVHHEIGVFYKVGVEDFKHDGLGLLDDLNIIDINQLDTYLTELEKRTKS